MSPGFVSRRWRLHPSLIVASTLLVAVCVIDPLRGFMSQDDGWAYARSVQRLLATGDYRLDAWSAANMPVQIYLAAAVAKLFGYSFGVLRLSTLALLCAALWSLHALLRERDVPSPAAAALTLVFLASPLVLMLAPTFMSDVQFIGWLLVALRLYVLGLRRGSAVTLLLGSIAAACAIGTRQFGIAILGGLAVAWLLPRRDLRPSAWQLVLAGAVPLLAAAWQLHFGLVAPNFTQLARLEEQRHFLAVPLARLAAETVWRLAVMSVYVGVQSIALLPLLVAAMLSSVSGADARQTAGDRRRGATVALLVSTAVAAALLTLGSSLTAREYAGHFLPLPWMLDNAFWDHPLLLRGLTVLGLSTMVLAIYLLARRRVSVAQLRGVPAHRLLPLSTGLILGLLHLGYVQLNDTYLIGLVPFLLLLLPHAIDFRRGSEASVRAVGVSAIGMILLLSLWIRGDYNRQEAQWQAADRLVAAGLDIRCVGGTRHWAEYHGAFDDWLAAGHPGFVASNPAGPAAERPPLLHPPFHEWLNRRFWGSTAQVSSSWGPAIPDGWTRIEVVPYRNMFFRLESIQVLQRNGPRPPWAEPCRHPEARAFTDLSKAAH